MIYVTGDVHGDVGRFKSKAAKRLRKGDTLLVCGDFGFVWDGSPKEQRTLKWLGKRPYHILFLDGTHDNLDLLAGYPEVELFGGRARQVSGNCYYLPRGGIYTIESDVVFVMGGGESGDMDARIEGKTWWPQELPSLEELDRARRALAARQNVVDYIVTHEPSSIVSGFLDMDTSRQNQLCAFLDEISRTVRYKHWFFGSCHLDKVIPPRHHAVYQEILPLKAQLRIG